MIFTHILSYNGIDFQLAHDPVGWQDVELRLERDRERHGIEEMVNSSLSFHCQGAGREFVENALGNGIDEIVTITVYIDCGHGNELYYRGTLKLPEAEITEDYITVPVEQVSIERTFASRMGTDVNINGTVGVDGQTLPSLTMLPIDFEYHSRAIKMIADLETTENDLLFYTFTGTSAGGSQATAQPTGPIWAIAIQPNILIPSPTFPSFVPTIPFHQNNANLGISSGNLLINYSANLASNIFIQAGNLTVTYDISGRYVDRAISPATFTRGVNSFSLLVRWGESLPTSQVITLGVANTPYTTGANEEEQLFSFNGSQTIDIGVNDKIWVFWFNNAYQITAGALSNSYQIGLEFSNFELNFDTDSVGLPTIAQAFPIYESTARLVDGICGAQIQSQYFGRTNSMPRSYPANGCGSFTVLANGYQIRNLRAAQVYVNFNELFKTLQSIFNVGWGWGNGVLIIEGAESFYNDTLIVELDGANNITRRVAAEFYTQKIEIGFEQWETNDLFITDETQTKRQYATRIRSVDGSIDAIAPYITSSYAIEVTRRLGGNDTYRDYNEKNFIIAATRELTDGKPLLNSAEIDENFSAVLNVRNSDTTYNLRFTPVKNLVRWFKTLNVGLISYLNDLVRYASGEGNVEAVTVDDLISCDGGYNGVAVYENGDYDTRLATQSEQRPLFEPMFVEIEYPLTWDEYKQIRANRYGYIGVNGEKIHVMQVVFRHDGNSQILGVRKWE